MDYLRQFYIEKAVTSIMSPPTGRGIRIRTLNDGVRAVGSTEIYGLNREVYVISVCRMSALLYFTILSKNTYCHYKILSTPTSKYGDKQYKT